MRTAMYVIKAATRSSPECAASARMPRLPVNRPTTIFMAVSPTAATSEFSAAERFSVSSVVSLSDTTPNLARRVVGAARGAKRFTADAEQRASELRSGLAGPTKGGALCRQHARQQCLRFALDGAQMVSAGEALRVELVDVFGAGGTGGEPSARGGHFQSAKSSAVAGRGGQHGKDGIAGQLVGGDLVRREFSEEGLLLGRCRGIDALVDRRAGLL